MGWKAVRDHYRIEHIVTVRGDGVELASPYGGPVARVDGRGRTTFETSYRGGGLDRVAGEIAADPGTYLRLLAEDDRFEASVPVYMWEDGRIVERWCEEPGWPNVTHDGRLMHENTHSTDRAEALRMAIADARAIAGYRAETVEDARAELGRRSAELERAVEALSRLEGEASAAT